MSGRRALQTFQSEVRRWARERAGYGAETIALKVGVQPDRVLEWERSGSISISQADRLAHHTHTPVGFLYLPQPPEDDLPIPDFRAAGDARPARPSPDLLETVHLMARRKAWIRDELIENGAAPLPVVGCCGADSTPAEAATRCESISNYPPTGACDSIRGLKRSATCGIASKSVVSSWRSTASWATTRIGDSTGRVPGFRPG